MARCAEDAVWQDADTPDTPDMPASLHDMMQEERRVRRATEHLIDPAKFYRRCAKLAYLRTALERIAGGVGPDAQRAADALRYADKHFPEEP